MLTPDFVKLSHNGASDAQASRCTDLFNTCIIEAENVTVWSLQQHSTNRNTINNGPACPSPVVYLDAINACGKAESPEEVMERHSDGVLMPLFSRLLCVSASSAPVERVFSQSGLIVRPNRTKMNCELLNCELMNRELMTITVVVCCRHVVSVRASVN